MTTPTASFYASMFFPTGEHCMHKFCAFASDLGLKPGQWPQNITLIGDFGNGRPYILTRRKPDGSHEYTQEFGIITLTLLND